MLTLSNQHMKKFITILLVFALFANIDCKDFMNSKRITCHLKKTIESTKVNCHQQKKNSTKNCSCPEKKTISLQEPFKKTKGSISLELIFRSPLNIFYKVNFPDNAYLSLRIHKPYNYYLFSPTKTIHLLI